MNEYEGTMLDSAVYFLKSSHSQRAWNKQNLHK